MFGGPRGRRLSRAGLRSSAWAPRENTAWAGCEKQCGNCQVRDPERRDKGGGLQPNKEKTAPQRHSPQSWSPSWPGSGTAGAIRAGGGAWLRCSSGRRKRVQSSAGWGGAEQSVCPLTVKRTVPTRRRPVPRPPFQRGKREKAAAKGSLLQSQFTESS